MSRTLFVLNIVFFLSFSLSIEAHTASMSLEDCVRLAKAQNPALRTARWEKDVSAQQVRQSDSALFPRIDIQGGYTAQLEAQAVKLNNQTMQMQQPSFWFSNLSIYQNIYDFGRRGSRREQARASDKAVESGIRSREQDVAMQVIEVYFGILEAQKLADSAREELKSVTDHKRLAQVMFDNGVVTRNDVLQADLRIASSRQKLLIIENKRKNLFLSLNFLLGRNSEEALSLQEPPEPYLEQHASNQGRLAFLARRPDLETIKRRIESAEQEIVESRSYFYPELFLRLNMDYLQNDRMREQAIYGATVGVKINIFDGFSSTAAMEKASASRNRMKEQLRQAEEQAKLELATVENDSILAKERILVARAAISQGEENLRININRYQERVGTATEVLDAQTLLSQAKAEYFSAWYDYQVSVARVRKARGEL